MPKVDIWMPIYIGDYLGDTIELSAAEHGAYLLLLMHYWLKKGEIGDDIERLSRVCKVDEKTCSFILGYYFTHEEGNYRNKRADIEMANAESRRLSASENGKKGGRPPANNPQETGRLTGSFPEGKPTNNRKGNPQESSSSSSSSSKDKEINKERVPDFEDDIADAFNESPTPQPSFKKSTLDARLAILSETWKRHPELPKYVCKLSANMKPEIVTGIDAILQSYTDAEIITAIDNYAIALPTIEPKYRIQSFQNFMANSGAIAKYQETKSAQVTTEHVCPVCHGKLKNGQYCKVCEKFFDENDKEMYV